MGALGGACSLGGRGPGWSRPLPTGPRPRQAALCRCIGLHLFHAKMHRSVPITMIFDEVFAALSIDDGRINIQSPGGGRPEGGPCGTPRRLSAPSRSGMTDSPTAAPEATGRASWAGRGPTKVLRGRALGRPGGMRFPLIPYDVSGGITNGVIALPLYHIAGENFIPTEISTSASHPGPGPTRMERPVPLF